MANGKATGGGQANNGPVANDDTIQLTSVDTSVMSFIIPASEVLANDTVKNGQNLSIVSAQGVTGATVQITQTGDLQVFPTDPYHPSDVFDYTISDGHGGASTAKVTVDYAVANSPPIANNGSIDFQAAGQTGEEIAAATILANANDPDGDPLSFLGIGKITREVLSGANTNPISVSVINDSGPAVLVQQDGGFAAGTHITFQYLVGDSAGLSATGLFTENFL